MPGPGQGKRSNKKKWRENTLSANIAAVNAVITTLNIAKTTTSTVLPPSDIATQTAATDTVRATPKSNSVDNVRALQGDATVLEKTIKL